MPLYKDTRSLKRHGYLADFKRCTANIGDIYQLDDGRWHYLSNIAKLDKNFKINDNIVKSPTKSLFKFTQEGGTDFKLGVKVEVPEIADAELEINFKEEHSVFIALKNATVYTLDLEAAQATVEKIWKKEKYNLHPFKYFMVNEITEATSGTFIYSLEKGNTVKLRCKANIPVTGIEMVAEGNFTIETNTKEVLEIILEEKHAPLFSAVRRKIGGLWESLG